MKRQAALMLPAESAWRKWSFPAIVGIALLAQFLLGLHVAATKTVVYDEYWHLPVGLLNLSQREFHFDRLNPPLARMWCALPLWLARVEARTAEDHSHIGSRFHDDHPENYQRLFFYGRAMNLLLLAGLGVLLTCWSRCWFGEPAALGTLVFFATCPNLLAHASVVTTDIAIVLGMAATTWALGEWIAAPSWKRAAIWGLLIGASLAVKFTGLLLFPCAGIAFGIAVWRNRWSWRLLGQGMLAIGLSLFVLQGAYLFQGVTQPIGRYQFQSRVCQNLQQQLPFRDQLPGIFPSDFLLGIDQQRLVMQQAHPVFLDGEWRTIGTPFYFWMTLIYKLPHALQLLGLLGIGWLWRFYTQDRWRIAWMFVPALLLMLVASREGMQLGMRYIFPVLPPLMISAGVLLADCYQRAGGWRRAAVVVAACAILSLRFHPHHLAYFNEFAGGPEGGSAHLVDSNCDWGQDLYLVKAYMADQRLSSIKLAYFGVVDPRKSGIDYELAPLEPTTGWYACSASIEKGRPTVILSPTGDLVPLGLHELAYFQLFTPVARLGYTINVYHIKPADLAEFAKDMRKLSQERGER